MKRNRGAVRHATNTPLTRVGLVSMYIYGGSVLAGIALLAGLLASGSLEGAFQVVIDYYVFKLLPWPFDELYMAETWVELVVSHGITIITGQLVASAKWWLAMG